MKSSEDPLDSVTLGSSSKVFYLEPGNIEQFQDVFVMACSGKVFGFNRCILAALSNVFSDIFKGLYQCPIANSDEKIFISSDLTETELANLQNYFVFGKFPSVEENLFRQLGLNLDLHSPELDGALETPAFLTAAQNNYVKIGCESEEMLDQIKVEEDFDLTDVGDEDFKTENVEFNDQPDTEWAEDDHATVTSNKRKRKAVADLGAQAKKENKKPRAAAVTGTRSSKRQKIAKDNASGQISWGNRANKIESKESFFYFPQDGERDLTLEFQCERCTRGFPDPDMYRQHFYRHDMPAPDYSKAFQCMRCLNFQASTKKAVAEHGKDE